MKQLGAIILAAGRGTRMNSTQTANKVASQLGGKPMITYTITRLNSLKIPQIVVVVGFAKESVMQALSAYNVIFANQEEQLGTGHALLIGLSKMPQDVETVVVMNGDDSAFYSKEVLSQLIEHHNQTQATVTLLTIHKDNPQGLGRIIRDESGKLIDIIEEKNATEEQKQIQEVNPGCYIFETAFLQENKDNIKKNELTGEYYINNFIELAVAEGKKVEAMKVIIPWRGVNTPEELQEAERIYQSTQEE